MSTQCQGMKRVGRPPEVDPETGEVMQKSLVNVTVPTKLVEFLRRVKVNRSQLFTKVVRMMYEDKICPKCYTTDVIKNTMGVRCNGYCSRYEPYFYKRGRCTECNERYIPKVRMPVFLADDKVVCEECGLDAKSKL